MAITQLQSRDLKVVCLADSIVERYEDSERRGHMRLGGDDVRWLRSARLKYGPDVRVLDISAGGILVETDGQLRPDANIVFELSGPTNSILVPSKVLRCRVASFADVMRYQGACSFKRAARDSRTPQASDDHGHGNNGTCRSTAARPRPRRGRRSSRVSATGTSSAATPQISTHPSHSCISQRSRIRATRSSCNSPS
jgi:hypothetical protein